MFAHELSDKMQQRMSITGTSATHGRLSHVERKVMGGSNLHVEAEEDYVTVLDFVVPTFETIFARLLRIGR